MFSFYLRIVCLVFSTVVIRHIYDRDQQLSPGALTMLKVLFHSANIVTLKINKYVLVAI